MKKKQPKTVNLKQFAKNFTPMQNKIAQDEIKYYYLLTQFKEAREKKGLSQEELAYKAQINRTTLSKVETGNRNATIDTLSKIALAMDMQLDMRLRSY